MPKIVNVTTISGPGFTLTIDTSKLPADRLSEPNAQGNRIYSLTGTGVGNSRYSALPGHDNLDVQVAVRLLPNGRPKNVVATMENPVLAALEKLNPKDLLKLANSLVNGNSKKGRGRPKGSKNKIVRAKA